MPKIELQEELLNTFRRLAKINIGDLFKDISREGYFMLEMIGKYTEENLEKKGICVSELAENLLVTSPAVSRMLRMLEKKNLIIRMVNEDNRRNTLVLLTEEGKEVRNRTRKQLNEFSGKVTAHIGTDDMKTLLTLWNELADAVETELKA